MEWKQMDDALELLQELVRIPSLSGQEHAAAGFLRERMAGLGYRAAVDEAGNAVGVLENPDSQGRITFEGVLLGHIDTVPGDIPVEVRDGSLYGRGSVDAKGPLAAFVIAAARAHLAPGTRLIVAGAVEEEAATSKGAWHLVENLPCRPGEDGRRSPDFCIIGEPSGWDAVTLGYKGRILFDFVLSQEMSHTAGPEQAVAEKAVQWWNDVRAYADRFNEGRQRVFDQLSPSLRHIETRSDGMRDSVCAKIGVRIPPGLDLDEFEAVVRGCAGETELDVYGRVPAHLADRNTALVRAFSTVLRGHGVRPKMKVKTGTSDMNVAGPSWACPIVAYGPGDSQLDHTPHEHLVIEDYYRAISTLTGVLENIQEVER
jgi:[amino group carrier protein]-lysine/ornithine hydrolase